MSSKISSLIICVFLLITISHFSPRCLSARNLAETNDWPWGVDEKGNNQSKSNVHGSAPGHAGSATNDNVPADGVVNVPPPTPIQRVINRDKDGFQYVQSNGNGNGVVTSSNSNGDQSYVNKNNGFEHVATRDGNGGQTVVSNNNGNESITTTKENGDQVVITRDKNGVETITVNNQPIFGNGVSPPVAP